MPNHRRKQQLPVTRRGVNGVACAAMSVPSLFGRPSPFRGSSSRATKECESLFVTETAVPRNTVGIARPLHDLKAATSSANRAARPERCKVQSGGRRRTPLATGSSCCPWGSFSARNVAISATPFPERRNCSVRSWRNSRQKFRSRSARIRIRHQRSDASVAVRRRGSRHHPVETGADCHLRSLRLKMSCRRADVATPRRGRRPAVTKQQTPDCCRASAAPRLIGVRFPAIIPMALTVA